jgi:CRP-like cAMP-binding protein
VRRSNGFLTSFGTDLDLIRPFLREITIEAGAVLCEPGDRITKVYFPNEGLISKMAVFEDGSEIECTLAGRAGAVGVMSALSLRTSVTRDVCHLRASASVVDAARLADAAHASARIHDALDCYCAWKMTYAIRNGACNAVHPVEQRLCRWLLTCADELEEAEIRLPQDVFAKMLGVQRTSVNPILQRLKADGVIALGRSRLILLDRERLIERACECYLAMRRDDAIAPFARSPAPVERLHAARRCG